MPPYHFLSLTKNSLFAIKEATWINLKTVRLHVTVSLSYKEFEYESDCESLKGDSERNVEAMETFFYEGEDCRVSNPDKALILFGQVVSSHVNSPVYNELYACCCFPARPYSLSGGSRR